MYLYKEQNIICKEKCIKLRRLPEARLNIVSTHNTYLNIITKYVNITKYIQ